VDVTAGGNDNCGACVDAGRYEHPDETFAGPIPCGMAVKSALTKVKVPAVGAA